MSTFDPMAAAIDWLDAYRAGSLSIVDYYASDAAIECGCGGMKVLCGRAALTGYWVQRFADMPAEDLIELQTDGDGIIICYRVPDGPVHATLYFNDDGKIARSVCGPTEDISRPPSDSICERALQRPH
ncbi:hypothetical protein [Bradyrhizobium valentinum]|uniref:hypothetical protein n=1 Tax=Bradyrhizobium valentinum TaxID=1518501 RepID=UPI00070A1901|nr:hypothetical protein [Bradyrhizobium valentinum]KRQ93939.1 hypothetical protein CQ10_34890 [Bradyrhizobium valentinum]